jgi:hypothetical protein
MAAKGGQHTLVTEILAPRFEGLGPHAAPFPFLPERLAQAVKAGAC